MSLEIDGKRIAVGDIIRHKNPYITESDRLIRKSLCCEIVAFPKESDGWADNGGLIIPRHEIGNYIRVGHIDI